MTLLTKERWCDGVGFGRTECWRFSSRVVKPIPGFIGARWPTEWRHSHVTTSSPSSVSIKLAPIYGSGRLGSGQVGSTRWSALINCEVVGYSVNKEPGRSCSVASLEGAVRLLCTKLGQYVCIRLFLDIGGFPSFNNNKFIIVILLILLLLFLLMLCAHQMELFFSFLNPTLGP